jgi:hypothetical protein
MATSCGATVASSVPDQPRRVTMRPEIANLAADSRTIFSFTSQANFFQLFQPIGGVFARPFDTLLTTACVVSAEACDTMSNADATKLASLVKRTRPPPPD